MTSATSYGDTTEKTTSRRTSAMSSSTAVTAVDWKLRVLRDIVPLGVCSVGICCCYWLYGYLQETLITRSRLGATFLLLIQAFTNVVVASVWMVVVSSSSSSGGGGGVGSGGGPIKNETTISSSSSSSSLVLNHRLLLMTSFCYVVAMISSNESLQYVSYSTAVLMKSCKLIPSLLMGKIVEKRSYNISTWISAIFISFGMCLFHSSKLLLSLSTHQEEQQQELRRPRRQEEKGGGGLMSLFLSKFQNKEGQGQGGGRRRHNDSASSDNDMEYYYWYGIGLLLLSLSMDGLLGACQGLLKKQQHHPQRQQQQQQQQRQRQSYYYRPPTAAETMFFINLYSMFVLIPLASSSSSGTYGTGDSQLKTGVELLQRDVSLRHAVVLMNGVVGIGQIFIFLSLTWYTPYITTLITTTRKFFTIVISVVLVNNSSLNNKSSSQNSSHNKEFGTVQWVAVILVFVGIYGSIMSAATTTATTATSSSSKSSKHGVTDGNNGDVDRHDDVSDDDHDHDVDKETKKNQ